MGVVQRLTRYALSATQPAARWITRGPRSSRLVALTFDDGPHPEQTPRLLDLLGELRIPATFFVVGSRAMAHPHLVKRMVREGHTVANHTWFHYEPARLSPLALAAEVRETRSLLGDLTGRSINLFRPPKGELTWAKIRTLWSLGQTIALWNVDPKDFAMPGLAAATAWEATYPPRGGDVVLFHDTHPWATGVLPQLAAKARRRGLEFTTLERWTTAQRSTGQPVEPGRLAGTSSSEDEALEPLESAVTS